MRINVKGGTNAGWKVEKPKPKPWKCPECSADNKYYNKNCPHCYSPRPD